MEYRPTIGLEIHVELNTKTKMFCGCKNEPDENHPNTNICPVCMGHPGTLPNINFEALKKIVLAGLALNCEIAENTFFERKNYFYPDLPKGYQISQFQSPTCANGFLEIFGKRIRIRRIHLEEDAGKLMHDQNECHSLVDYNRAGVPLMELVTEPDLNSGDEVKEFGEQLQLILRYLGVSDANMEKGQMRVEANISVSQTEELGTKVEVKNINSLRFARQAIDYEVKRQTEVLESGQKVSHETRGWDEKKQATFLMRSKEESHDYRYFPEPDLPPIKTNDSEINLDKIRASIPELPSQKTNRFRDQYGLPDSDIRVLVFNRELGGYFEEIISELKTWENIGYLTNPGPEQLPKLIKLCANYLITELQKIMTLQKNNLSEIGNIKISPKNFADFIVRIFNKEISSSGAQTLLKQMFETGDEPKNIIEQKGLSQISNTEELIADIRRVIAENKKSVDDYKNGKQSALQFLVGKAMAKTKGRANPQIAKQLLEQEMNI